MKKERKPPARRPAPPPKTPDQEALDRVMSSIKQAIVAANGALNITAANLRRRMDEGFEKLEELIAQLKP